jgi:hypothetical protein
MPRTHFFSLGGKPHKDKTDAFRASDEEAPVIASIEGEISTAS